MNRELKKLKLTIRQHNKAMHSQSVTQVGPPFRVTEKMQKEASRVAAVLLESRSLEGGYYDLLLLEGNVVLDQAILIA